MFVMISLPKATAGGTLSTYTARLRRGGLETTIYNHHFFGSCDLFPLAAQGRTTISKSRTKKGQTPSA